MRSYFFHSPNWLKMLFPYHIWKIDTTEKVVFLTFDDGPDPLATKFVLDQLTMFSAKATFFCVGNNIQKYPDLARRVLEEGHAIGNHTFQHLNGWKTSNEVYLEDVQKCEAEIRKLSTVTCLFRPPFGRIRQSQACHLTPQYKIVMWSHLAGDFDKNLHFEAAKRALLLGRPGSIFLFHDSFAAYKNLIKLLPVVLEYYSRSGYTFKSLSDAVN